MKVTVLIKKYQDRNKVYGIKTILNAKPNFEPILPHLKKLGKNNEKNIFSLLVKDGIMTETQ